MKKLAFAVWIITVIAVVTAGGVFAQSPMASPIAPLDTDMQKPGVHIAAPPPISPATDTGANLNTKTEPLSPGPAASVSANIDINKAETVNTPPASSTTMWGMDGKTVLIGGALLLGIILIAVAAASRDQSTPVVR